LTTSSTQPVTKYRKKVINKEILNRLEQIFRYTCFKWESSVVEFNAEEDHVHLLIDYNPKVQISKLVNNLKTVSSRLIRKEFAVHVGSFYISPSFGQALISFPVAPGVTLEPLKDYVLAPRISGTIDLLQKSMCALRLKSGAIKTKPASAGLRDSLRRQTLFL
jgi:putative transposase